MVTNQTVSPVFAMFLHHLKLSSRDIEGKTHTTHDPDQSVRFGEFCLRMSDESHRTSSELHLPTKSANPTKHGTQPLEQPTTEPTHVSSQSAQPPTEPTPLPEQTAQPETREHSSATLSVIAPLGLHDSSTGDTFFPLLFF